MKRSIGGNVDAYGEHHACCKPAPLLVTRDNFAMMLFLTWMLMPVSSLQRL